MVAVPQAYTVSTGSGTSLRVTGLAALWIVGITISMEFPIFQIE